MTLWIVRRFSPSLYIVRGFEQLDSQDVMELFQFSNDDLLCAECIEHLVVGYLIDHSYLKHLSRPPWPLQKSYFCIASFIRTNTLRSTFYLRLACIAVPGWQKQVEGTIPHRRRYESLGGIGVIRPIIRYSITITFNPLLILILRSLPNAGT